MRTLPKARLENIVVQDLENQTLVCDLKNNHIFCLNQTAGEVWKLCDGERSVDEIDRILSRKFGRTVGREMILLTLDELSKEFLLAEKFSSATFYNKISRRDIIKKAGLVSAFALPLVSSVVMPTSSLAASGGLSGVGGACVTNLNCQLGLSCVAGTCRLDFGQACAANFECSSGFCTDGVCCNNACTGTCEKCNLPGTIGFCSAIPLGQDPDNECPSGPGLSGFCNGFRACF